MKTLLVALGLTGALAAAGCGGSGGDDVEDPDLGGGGGGGGGGEAPPATGPVNARGQDDAEARVGPAGGLLELSNGARVEIPAGALNESTQIAIRIGPPTQAVGRREGEQQIGPVILIEPAVVVAPGHRIVVSIPLNSPPSGYEPSDLAIATEEPDESRSMDMGSNSTRWSMGPAIHQGGRLRAEVEQLHGMRLQFVASR